MHSRPEGKVAALIVKREFVKVHLAGADHLYVVLDIDFTLVVNSEIRRLIDLVLICPA